MKTVLANPADFTTPEVFQIVGYLTAAIPELHTVEVPTVCDALTEAMKVVRDSRDTEPEGERPIT